MSKANLFMPMLVKISKCEERGQIMEIDGMEMETH